jgi:hypothetical protein
LRAAAPDQESGGTAGVDGFRWGERRVLVAPVRWFDDGSNVQRSSRYLTRSLRGAAEHAEFSALIDLDTVVIAVDAGRTLASVARLAGEDAEGPDWVVPLAETEHFSVFRIDAERYRFVLNERRDAVRSERGRRPLGFE